MRLVLRQATSADAPAIARLIHDAFDEEADETRIVCRIGSARGHTIVAESSGAVAGFIDCFETIGADGEVRMELDLLSVSREARGHGIGTRLFAASLELARQSDASFARALIAHDNRAMQRIAHRAGFLRGAEHGLYVTPRPTEQEPFPAIPEAHLVRVETLTYSGIWIEGEISEAALRRALWLACQENRSTVGAVVDHCDAAARLSLAACDFILMGSYNWWHLSL